MQSQLQRVKPLHICALLLVLGKVKVAGASSAFLVRTSGSETGVAGLGLTEWW